MKREDISNRHEGVVWIIAVYGFLILLVSLIYVGVLFAHAGQVYNQIPKEERYSLEKRSAESEALVDTSTKEQTAGFLIIMNSVSTTILTGWLLKRKLDKRNKVEEEIDILLKKGDTNAG